MYARGYRPLEAAKGRQADARGGNEPKIETGRPKPEDGSRKLETGNDEHDDPNRVLRRRLLRKTQEMSGRCHEDFHSPKAALAVIPSHIILWETTP